MSDEQTEEEEILIKRSEYDFLVHEATKVALVIDYVKSIMDSGNRENQLQDIKERSLALLRKIN